MSRQTSWVGFDLDGTLADERTRNGIWTIGDPIPSMIDRLRRYLAEGVKVKILLLAPMTPGSIPLFRIGCARSACLRISKSPPQKITQ